MRNILNWLLLVVIGLLVCASVAAFTTSCSASDEFSDFDGAYGGLSARDYGHGAFPITPVFSIPAWNPCANKTVQANGSGFLKGAATPS